LPPLPVRAIFFPSQERNFLSACSIPPKRQRKRIFGSIPSPWSCRPVVRTRTCSSDGQARSGRFDGRRLTEDVAMIAVGPW